MKLKDIHLNVGQIPGVPSNPRYITDKEFKELKKSLKNFTKMLALRPIVVDENHVILGGNMRYQAICKLAEEGATTPLHDKDGAITGYYKFDGEIPDEWVCVAADLSPEEKMEFIIKDNQERGEWDFDKLESEWETNKPSGWELPKDTRWKPEAEADVSEFLDKGGNADSGHGDSGAGSPAGGSGESEPEPNFDLPPELEGLDIEPDKLPDIKGTDDRECVYLIITFMEEQRNELAERLGIKALDKVLYNLEELEYIAK